MPKTMFNKGAAALALLALTACGPKASDTAENQTAPVSAETPAATETAVETNAEAAPAASSISLDAALAMQEAGTQARYPYRNPKATLELFGVQPGMTVVEVLPGSGWYSKILLPYLGDEGTLIGADYGVDMWSQFGGFANDKFLEDRKSWTKTWSNDALAWRGGTQANVSAFAFESLPRDMRGTADAVLMFRALHHLNRFDAAYWDGFMADTKAVLKPGGLVGIVQHRAPETASESWANGDNGYLKQSFVIEKFTEAGFELVGNPSDINANAKDTPTAEDTVWRLPPTLGTSRDKPELKAKMEAIGESDRMTLVFRKK